VTSSYADIDVGLLCCNAVWTCKALKIEAVCPSEILVSIYKFIRRYNQKADIFTVVRAFTIFTSCEMLQQIPVRWSYTIVATYAISLPQTGHIVGANAVLASCLKRSVQRHRPCGDLDGQLLKSGATPSFTHSNSMSKPDSARVTYVTHPLCPKGPLDSSVLLNMNVSSLKDLEYFKYFPQVFSVSITMPRWYNEVREEWSLPLDMTFSREV
jgi:hypothetical protein